MIAIIDYGMGNLRSLQYKLLKDGIDCLITNNPDEIANSTKIILPGVGNFKKAMENIHKLNLFDVLNNEVLINKKNIMGICLGMQLLTDYSEEGNVDGLGWINAKTIKFNFNDNSLRIPHVGWNSLNTINEHKYLKGVDENEFYFTHSYYVLCKNEENVISKSNYGIDFDSIIVKDNIFGTQFHPEKSHLSGFKLISNFAKS